MNEVTLLCKSDLVGLELKQFEKEMIQMPYQQIISLHRRLKQEQKFTTMKGRYTETVPRGLVRALG
jgi:hypothetical protein